MKLLRTDGDRFEFELARREKDLLFQLLDFYPLVPESHHRLSRGGQVPDPRGNQRLLDEALQAQRQANKKQLVALLNEPGRFIMTTGGFRFGFERDEIEWLLQVLNDVRIGSWIALGSPGYAGVKQFPADKQSLRHAAIMDIAGGFESYFLGAVSGDLPPEESGP